MPRFDFLKRRKGRSAQVGRLGEKAAAWHLWRNGYRILERNYSNDLGEIDLIAEDHGVCVFVEVKTRTKRGDSPRPGEAASAPDGSESQDAEGEAFERDAIDAVDERKIARMKRTAAVYLRSFLPARFPHRFDAMTVDLRGEKAKVKEHRIAIAPPIPADYVALHSSEARHAEEALRRALARSAPPEGRAMTDPTPDDEEE